MRFEGRDAADGEWDDRAEAAESEPRLVVDLGGFEGPLDLLLDLARRQKVDLHEVSILLLAEQYIAFIEEARALRLELAADYLVMAAWLAFLKSRLLLPEPPKPEGPCAAELATALAARLRRLEAIREAARFLGDRPLLGREVFASGLTAVPDPVPDRPVALAAALHDLLAAYGRGRHGPERPAAFVVSRPRVWTLAEARAALERLVGAAIDWFDLEEHLRPFLPSPDLRATVTASFLSAALEMVREGAARLAQDAAFGPIRLAPPERVAA